MSLVHVVWSWYALHNHSSAHHASSDMARDGCITVHVENLTTECQFLWTTGVVTNSNVLYDVTPGTYGVTLVSYDRVPIIFYHACAPAKVEIQ